MSSVAEAEHREEEVPLTGDDEDTGAPVAPIVRLEEVAVTTGEENEDAILDMKAKLYRFDEDGKQWKERGAGTVKLLKHRVRQGSTYYATVQNPKDARQSCHSAKDDGAGARRE